MRHLIITVLPALILLCVPISTTQSRGLHSIRRTPHMIDQLCCGAPATSTLRPGASPAQAQASERGAPQNAQESISLELGKPVERELSGGQSHSYKITMTSGLYLHVVVAQRGIDVSVALFTPDGKKIIEADSEHLIQGSESVSAIAEVPGANLVEVRSPEKTAKTGRYEIKLEELRAATAEDNYRVAGESAFREAEQLKDGTQEDRRKSIEKYQEALELYRRASERNGEAQTLNNIGVVDWSLGEMQKALEKYNEALPIRRAVGDRRGEAETLNNIGAVYNSLGETQKALDEFNESLPIRREVGDRRGEAVTLNNIGHVYYSLGETRKALEKYNESLPIKREVGDRSGEAVTLASIGTVYQSLGETQKALEKYNESLLISRAVSDRNGEAFTQLGIARVEQKRGNLSQARQAIEQAISLVESLRTKTDSQELRSSFFASR